MFFYVSSNEFSNLELENVVTNSMSYVTSHDTDL